MEESPNTESRRKLAQDCSQRQTRGPVFTSTLRGLLKPSGVRTSQVVSLHSPNNAKGTAANVFKKWNVGTLVVNSQIKENNTEKLKKIPIFLKSLVIKLWHMYIITNKYIPIQGGVLYIGCHLCFAVM